MMLEKINLNNLDKSNWVSFRFEDIAAKISETVDPNTTALEKYIGLEHIDAEDIHIRRCGRPSDVSGGKLKFYPGDVIFGKRRAYQRKAAIAEFEGICSAHAFVFRANPEVIDPKLFPFFLHSDQFMHRAVDISVGGLSPTINWGALKAQEFFLPPKSEQDQLVELLWAMNEVIERENNTLCKAKNFKNSLQKYLFNRNNFTRVKLSEYTSVLSGYAFPSSKFIAFGAPVIKIKNITNGNITIDSDSNHIDEKYFENISKYKVKAGDILIAMTGATLGKTGVVQNEFEGAYINQRVGKFKLKKQIYSNFLKGILDSQNYLFELNKYIGEGAQGNISSDDICNTLVPKLDVIEVEKHGNTFKYVLENITLIKEKISTSQSLQKSLINQIF